MADWSGSLARAFATHLKNRGSSGSAGSRPPNPKGIRGLDQSPGGTSGREAAVPMVLWANDDLGTGGTNRLQAAVPLGGISKPPDFRDFREGGTGGTSGTSKIVQSESTTSVADDRDSPAEPDQRAAAPEYGSDVPAEWAKALAALSLAPPAEGFTPNEWHRIVDDAARFVEGWSAQATQHGWGILDVFGVHLRAPASRYDAMGLVPLIRGGEVVALNDRRATIRMPSGGELIYLRRPRKDAVPIWEVARAGAGRTDQ